MITMHNDILIYRMEQFLFVELFKFFYESHMVVPRQQPSQKL